MKQTIIWWRKERHILAAFTYASELFHSVLVQWCIVVWSWDNTLNRIVSFQCRFDYFKVKIFNSPQFPVGTESTRARSPIDALTPIARMLLSIIQMQFIFLNTTDLDMGRHKVICRFGLMHMIATNICEWLHVLVEETKHDIHLNLSSGKYSIILWMGKITKYVQNDFNFITVPETKTAESAVTTETNSFNSTQPKIMADLIHDASPFLFPCVIEYSLIW